MRSCERPSNSSTNVFFPSSVSKTYSLSTRTHGSSWRCFAISSSSFPSSCSRSSSFLRAADHSSIVPTACFGMAFPPWDDVQGRPAAGGKLIGRGGVVIGRMGVSDARLEDPRARAPRADRCCPGSSSRNVREARLRSGLPEIDRLPKVLEGIVGLAGEAFEQGHVVDHLRVPSTPRSSDQLAPAARAALRLYVDGALRHETPGWTGLATRSPSSSATKAFPRLAPDNEDRRAGRPYLRTPCASTSTSRRPKTSVPAVRSPAASSSCSAK